MLWHPLRRDLNNAMNNALASVAQTQERVNALRKFAFYLDDLDIEPPTTSAIAALTNAQNTLNDLSTRIEAWSIEMEKPTNGS